MRVVVDTNVLVRAASIAGDSPARQLLRLLREPPHLLIISHFLLNELLRALSYERVRRVHGLDDALSLVQSRPDLRQSDFELEDLMGK